MASIYKRDRDRGKKRAVWHIAYNDHTGKRRTRKGFTDKAATEKLAAQIEDEQQMIREGLKQPTHGIDRKAPISKHIDEFEAHLSNRDVTEKQVHEVTYKVRRIVDGCGFQRLRDLDAGKVEQFLGLLREEGMSKQTSNHYVRAAKQFCRWLVKTRRAHENPLADVPTLNVQTDRRHDRRPLSGDEFMRLIVAADEGKPIETISGPDRVMMYVLSAWTGYRKGEIGSLTPNSFDLESEPPTVTVQASYSKRRRTDVQVLHQDVADRLKLWMAEKPDLRPDTLLFPVSDKVPGGKDRKTAKMMRRDLEAARKAWIDEAEEDEEERKRREQSDFLRYKDSRGKYADFHANRHTFITNLGRAGVSPKTAQMLARHSDIRLTMNTYTHTDLAEKTEAVGRLPGVWQRIGSAPDSQDGTNGHSTSGEPPGAEETAEAEATAEVVSESGLNAISRQLSEDVSSTPGGIRTPNPRFRRPKQGRKVVSTRVVVSACQKGICCEWSEAT